MFAVGEMVRELTAPEEGGLEGRVVATYMIGYGMDADQEVYVQPKATSAPEAQVKFLASDLMLADQQLTATGGYGFEVTDTDDGYFSMFPVPNRK